MISISWEPKGGRDHVNTEAGDIGLINRKIDRGPDIIVKIDVICDPANY